MLDLDRNKIKKQIGLLRFIAREVPLSDDDDELLRDLLQALTKLLAETQDA